MAFLSHHFRQIFIENYKCRLKKRLNPYQSNHLHLNERIEVYPMDSDSRLNNEVDYVVAIVGLFKR